MAAVRFRTGQRFWTFERRWLKACASESILDAVNRQLSSYGYIAYGGQMADASIVQAPKQWMDDDQKACIGKGVIPIDWKPTKRRQKDTEARRTEMRGKSCFGN